MMNYIAVSTKLVPESCSDAVWLTKDTSIKDLADLQLPHGELCTVLHLLATEGAAALLNSDKYSLSHTQVTTVVSKS